MAESYYLKFGHKTYQVFKLKVTKNQPTIPFQFFHFLGQSRGGGQFGPLTTGRVKHSSFSLEFEIYSLVLA